MIVRLGGPSYELATWARHGMSLAATTHELGLRSAPIQLDYEHGCPPALARHELFKRALASDATVLWWADADVAWSADDALAVIDAVGPRAPVIVIPYELRRGGVWSIHDGSRWLRRDELPSREPRRVLASGLGATCIHLPTFRERWPTGPWFVDTWQGGELLSEDITFTASLERAVGARALCWNTTAEHRPAGAGAQRPSGGL